MRMTKIALLAVALCGLAVMAQAATWDVVADFSTTTPQLVKDGAYWEYGYVNVANGLYTPFTAGQVINLGGTPAPVACWYTGDPATSAIIGRNDNATGFTDGYTWLEPGQLLVHPSPGGFQPAVIRFWALRDMSITMAATFSGQCYPLNSGYSTKCTVGALRNGVGTSIGTVDGFVGGGGQPAVGPAPVFSFTETWSMVAGDHYDFIVVPIDRPSFQGTAFTCTITEVPEPCTMLAVAAGLGGLIIRRRRA